MKVLIVGGGIAGLTLGAFLERLDGVEYKIVEKSKDWSHQGFSLGIWSAGRKVLSDLGLGDKFDNISHPINKFSLESGRGKELKRVDFANKLSNRLDIYSHVFRSDLHSLLRSCVSDVNTGVNIKNINQCDNYDLIVGADGVNSFIRGVVNQEVEKNSRSVLYLTSQNIECDGGVARLLMESGRQAYIFNDNSVKTIVLISNSSYNNGDIRSVKEDFAGFPDIVDALESTINNQILFTAVKNFSNKSSWTNDNIVLIGDAAHPMSPYGGLGASMALEDAQVLSEEIKKIMNGKEMKEAFSDYESVRKPRVKQAMNITDKFQFITSLPVTDRLGIRKRVASLIPSELVLKDFRKLLSED